MKIAIIVPSFPTITETFIVNHITGLIDEGHDVTVFALDKNILTRSHQIIDRYDLMRKTIFVRRPPHSKTLCRSYAFGLILKYGLRSPLKMFRAVSSLLKNQSEFYPKLFFFLSIIEMDFDIYHFHFAQIGLLGSTIKEMGLPIKMVTSLHGYDVNRIPLTKPKNYYEVLFRYGDHFVANTNFTKQQVVQLGCDESKISVIPVGLHIRDFPYNPRKIGLNETVQILTVGRLVEKKGHEYSIRAIAGLINKGFRIHYTIAGDGPLKEQLEAIVKALNIQQHVTFKGEVTQEDVVELYKRSHLFVLASVTASDGDKEGQGLVLQEAQACGLPVVSTLHNGIPEGVLDGGSGFLVPEKDSDALSDKIEYVLGHPEKWEGMGMAGKDFIRERYDVPCVVGALLEVYKRLT